jgi:predicted phosphodiesterase
MRIALISDIHGNGTALEAVLDDIDRQRVDSIVCLGDVPTLGPQPKEVLDRIRGLGCPCILGNHESALFEPEKAAYYHIAPHLISSLEWCAGQLSADDFRFMRSFRPTLEISLGDSRSMLCYHGSPLSNIDNIFPDTPFEELRRLLDDQAAGAILAGGHTHFQMLRQYKGRPVVNPGSVGSAFFAPSLSPTRPTLLPWAEYGLIDTARDLLSVDLRRVRFDLDAFLRILDASGLPMKDWWRGQYTSPPVNW